MVANCVVGVCLALLCAAPVLGEEGNKVASIKLAKFIEQTAPMHKLPEALPPQVKVSEDFQYYDIDGITSDELRAQMKHNGTTWNDGKVYAALTTWDIRYHYDIKQQDGSYRLSDISTNVDIVFHMPNLVRSKAPQPLTLSWDSYLGNLKTHEFGHRDIAVNTGRELYQELAALGSYSSKDELDAQAKALVKVRFHRLKEAQIEYDAETHHGIKQGAVLADPMVAGSLPKTN
jgi:predicted secreted Zn-dependent protease